MASPLACLLLLLSLPILAAAQSPAPSISPTEPDPVEILSGDGRFSILLELLTKADLVGAIKGQLNTSGITLLAPTDYAFGKILDTLDKLSDANKTTILLYHALDKYVTFSDLEVEGKPRATLAPGLTLNFTRQNGLVNVSTGVVNTVVGSLYDKFPLGIFPVQDVLIPETFGAALPPPSGSEPSAPPTPGVDITPPPSSSAAPPRSGSAAPPQSGSTPPPPNSAAGLKRVGWEVVVLGALACMSFSV